MGHWGHCRRCAAIGRAPRMDNATRLEPMTNAVHLCVDMQNIFARGGIWETPRMERVLPAIVDITARYTARTVFTRFITPLRPEDRPGRWQRYFTKWVCATRDKLPTEQLELIPAGRTPIVSRPFPQGRASSDARISLCGDKARAITMPVDSTYPGPKKATCDFKAGH